jgi:hypothetical protein
LIARSAFLLAAALCAVACASNPPPPPPSLLPPPKPQASAPAAVIESAGDGPLQVYGASVYSPGQEIYKQLRQEDSLMAFLACQGEPDRVEVIETPGESPRIVLEYSRSGLRQRGTVDIAPSRGGFYAAEPIDPSGRLSSAKSEPPRRRAPPKATPKPAPQPQDEPGPEPAPEETAAPEPSVPEPSPSQLDECPIEPWRPDCRALCGPGAAWEWCSYRD